jgi:hypothetical protein
MRTSNRIRDIDSGSPYDLSWVAKIMSKYDEVERVKERANRKNVKRWDGSSRNPYDLSDR